MTDHVETAELTLVPAEGLDRVVVDRLTRNLAEELRKLDLDSVERPSRQTEDRSSRSGTVATIGTLLISGLMSKSALEAVVALTQSWLRRNEQDSVVVQLGEDRIEITGSRAEKPEQLLEGFYRRRGENT